MLRHIVATQWMMDSADQTLLDALPAHLSISHMFKATPAMEAGDRFVYLEASNEAVDQQGEVVLAKALEDSADYFLRFGNLDLDHYTQIGAKNGIPGYELYEIGRPVDVRCREGKTFVKGQIYSGTGPAAERANNFWSSVTELSPPQRWFPSVGGAVLGKSIVIDPVSKSRRAVIQKVRWTNVAFSKTPVNPNLLSVSTVPFGALAKCWGMDGLDLAKALETGFQTDMAQATGGAALPKQSLDHKLHSYWDMRDALSEAVRRGRVKPKPSDVSAAVRERFDLSHDEAGEFTERFFHDLQNARKSK